MTDWSDEVKARLWQEAYECHCTSPDDCCQDCADIRAALSEIDRRGIDAVRVAEAVNAQLASLQDSFTRATQRAEAAEAKLAEAEALLAIAQADRAQLLDMENRRGNEQRMLEAKLAEAEKKLALWERLIGAEMPPDYKDWHQNSKAEWPDVAAASLRSRKADADLAWDTVAKLGAEVERLSKMCCVCEGDCCRLAKERKVEIEQWREALSFAEGCIPAQIMLALRLSGMPESRATVGEIAAWLRAALRGGGEHSKHPTGDHCVYCRSQWPCEESGGE